MKTIYLKNKIITALLLLVVAVSSCVNDLNVTPIDPDSDQEFDQDAVFAKVYASLAITGQEGPSGDGDLAGIDEGFSSFFRLLFYINELPTDEAICGWTDAGVPELYEMNWTSSNDFMEGLYYRLCYDVTLCNHFLEETSSESDDETTMERAEVRFIRALNYYYLMDVYANPPFSETVSTENPEQISRSDLFDYIETELDAIVDDMAEPRDNDFGRVDKAAVWLLQSRLFLNAEVYNGTDRYEDAITAAQKVIDSDYALCPNYEELFMADNDENEDAMQEIIFPIRQDGTYTYSYGGSLFVIASTHKSDMPSYGTTQAWYGIRARKAFVDIFFPDGGDNYTELSTDEMIDAAGDDRAMLYSIDRSYETTDVSDFTYGYSVAKWTNNRSDGEDASNSTYPDTDIPFMRVSEAYLNLAEASLRNGSGSTDATVLNAVNALRERANASDLTSVSLDDILDERAKEFYYEGYRRSDLIRYDYFTTSNYTWDWKGGSEKGTSVSSIYNICPIPDSDLNANSNLVQNDGY